MVHALRVVPDEILHEAPVEFVQIGEQQRLVPVQELFPESPVEPLDVGIHLRRTGVGMVMHDSKAGKFCRKLLFPFAPVVREDEGNGEREHFLEPAEEFFRGSRSMGRRAQCKTEAAEEVFDGNDIPPHAVQELFHRIKGHAMARVFRLEILGFPQDFCAVGPLDLPEVGDHVRFSEPSQIRDQAADRADVRTRQPLLTAPFGEQRMELLLAEIRMLVADPPDLMHDERIPDPFPPSLRGAGPGSQAFDVPIRLFEFLLPEKQGAAFRGKGIERGLEPVLFPEQEDAHLLLGIFGDHAQP